MSAIKLVRITKDSTCVRSTINYDFLNNGLINYFSIFSLLNNLQGLGCSLLQQYVVVPGAPLLPLAHGPGDHAGAGAEEGDVVFPGRGQSVVVTRA